MPQFRPKSGASPLSYPGTQGMVPAGSDGRPAVSVLKRGNSKHWYIQFQFRGKTFIRSARTTDKRVAEQMEREWRRQLHAQEFLGQRERITLKVALDQFCESRQGTPNHYNLVTKAGIVGRLMRTSRYLDEVTTEDLERLKQERLREGIGAATIKHTVNVVRGAIKHARRMGYLTPDIDYPEIRTPKHRLRYLTADEEKRLLAELDPKREALGLRAHGERRPEIDRFIQDSYDLVVLLLDTGARYSEIAGLEWRQVNLTDRSIHLWRPKVRNESILYMTDRVYRILTRRSAGQSGSYVFTNKAGTRRGVACHAIRKAFHRAGLDDCSIHTLRHTHATRLIQNGMSIYEVKEILGHADIKTTMRYAHLEQREVSSKARDVMNRLNRTVEKPELKVV